MRRSRPHKRARYERCLLVSREDVLARVVAPTLFRCILDMPVFALLRETPRLGGLALVFPDELGQFSLFSTTLRLVQLATQWAQRMRPWCGSLPQDRLCLELAALISQLGQCSWLRSNCVHGPSTERSSRDSASELAMFASGATAALSIELFKQCVLSTPAIAAQLTFNGIGHRELELTYSFLLGTYNNNHPYSLILINRATSVDAKTLELCLCLSAYWRAHTASAFLAWSERDVMQLLDSSGSVQLQQQQPLPPTRADGGDAAAAAAATTTIVMAFEQWAAPLLQKLYAGLNHFQNVLNMHEDLHALHLLKATLTTETATATATDKKRLQEFRAWAPVVVAERVVATAADVSSAGYDMMVAAGVFQNAASLRLDDWFVSTIVYNCTSDAAASRVHVFFGAFVLPFNLRTPSTAPPLAPPFGVVRLFRRRSPDAAPVDDDGAAVVCL